MATRVELRHKNGAIVGATWVEKKTLRPKKKPQVVMIRRKGHKGRDGGGIKKSSDVWGRFVASKYKTIFKNN